MGACQNKVAPNRLIDAVSVVCYPVDFVHTKKFELRRSSCPYLIMTAYPRVFICVLTINQNCPNTQA